MARPCGCAGECGCTIVGVDGIKTYGIGSSRDPLRVGLANPITGAGCDAIMSCVGARVGAGLRYDSVAKTIAAKISGDSGNGLVYGTDLGLYAAGTGGGGGESGITVASLPTTDLIGGSYGAGYGQWPEGSAETYRAAMSMGLQLIHVPVRRTGETYLVAMHNRDLGQYNYRYSGNQSWAMDLKMLHGLTWYPGGDPQLNVSTGDVLYFPQAGNFGFGHRISRGATLLSDVFTMAAKRAVLYLECKDIGAAASDVASPSTTYAVLQQQIRQYGVQKSVIVGSELNNNADRADIISGLQKLKNEDGVAIAAHIVSQAQADYNTGAKLVGEGFSWVFMSYAIADTNPAQVASYKNAGLSVMLYGGHRQWHYTLTKTVAARGILCPDPVYVSGPLSNFRYRKTKHTWEWAQADYGRYAYGTTFEYMRDKYRGYVANGQGNTLVLDGPTMGPHETDPTYRPSGYYILMGEQCPIQDTRVSGIGSPNYYDIDVSFSWDALVSDRIRWMGLWFGSPEDRSITEYTLATQYTKGYQLQLSQNGTFSLTRWDGVPYPGTGDPFQFLDQWDSGWGTITPGTFYRIKVRVRPDRIVVGRADEAEGGAHTKTYTGTNGTKWRGPYFYLGRHFFNTHDSTTCRFNNLVVTPGTSV